MSDLMQDIIEGRIGYREANAVCNAGGKMLKVIEMTARFGRKPGEGEAGAVLELAPPPKQVA